MMYMLTAGADRMAQMDPHGWTLAAISIGVVFSALLLLYLIYSAIGKVMQESLKKRNPEPVQEEDPDETMAAIALALHLYMNENFHDYESGIITIQNHDTGWGDKSRTFRRIPEAK